MQLAKRSLVTTSFCYKVSTCVCVCMCVCRALCSSPQTDGWVGRKSCPLARSAGGESPNFRVKIPPKSNSSALLGITSHERKLVISVGKCSSVFRSSLERTSRYTNSPKIPTENTQTRVKIGHKNILILMAKFSFYYCSFFLFF